MGLCFGFDIGVFNIIEIGYAVGMGTMIGLVIAMLKMKEDSEE